MNRLRPSSPADLDAFIARWSGGDGGQERANYALFLSELCDVLGAPRPDQASHDTSTNAYTFERAVTFREPDGTTARGRIDLYKRGCFVLEAKQSRRPGGSKAVPEQADLLAAEEVEAIPRGKRTASRAWDVLMMSARRQAEDYAKALPISEGWPPFLIVCDVGHFEAAKADWKQVEPAIFGTLLEQALNPAERRKLGAHFPNHPTSSNPRSALPPKNSMRYANRFRLSTPASRSPRFTTCSKSFTRARR